MGIDRVELPTTAAPYRVRYAAAPLPPELLDVEATLASGRGRLLQANDRTTVVVVPVGATAVVVKRFREHTLARVLETVALGSGAARVRRGALRLRASGFDTPEIVAVLERRRFGIPVASCAVMSFVGGPVLDALWRTRGGVARRRLTLAFADYLRRLHAAGLYPQDLRGANVLVPREDPPCFVLVDLDRVRRYRRLSWRRRRKNLVQVHRSIGRGAPLRDGARFLRRYLGPLPLPNAVRRAGADIVRLGRVKDAEYARRRAAAAAVRAQRAE